MLIITVTSKGAQLEAMEKVVTEALRKKYPKASVSVRRKDPATSRSARFTEANDEASSAKGTAEELRDEPQEWRDGLPENLQDGDKSSELDDAISNLEEFIEALETAEGVSVDFPGMY